MFDAEAPQPGLIGHLALPKALPDIGIRALDRVNADTGDRRGASLN
jgi:hypothetical protein